MEFKEFSKISRWSREIIITEKLDGTNGCIYNGENGEFLIGSRTRWITPDNDNYGFAKWAYENKNELQKLGVGYHYGEWWGCGIQRGYGLKEKRFSLFNTIKWEKDRPECCNITNILYKGILTGDIVDKTIEQLKINGSYSAPGFMRPEGIVIFHTAANICFKKTIDKDDIPKTKV